MAKEPASARTNAEDSHDGKPVLPVCGVIMPITGAGDYTDEHCRRVQRIILKAIQLSGMSHRLVWENPEVDVIHSRILQNIYESDVVVCDVSGLNPNVMLELGLRLSTKKPTVVITDGIFKPPFDISVYQYHYYPNDLEYNSVDNFITELSRKIELVYKSYSEGKYKSFVENFTFEVVEPREVTVPAEEAMRERLDALSQQLRRLESRLINSPSSHWSEPTRRSPVRMVFESDMVSSQLKNALSEIGGRKNVWEVVAEPKKPYGHRFIVSVAPNITGEEAKETNDWIAAVIKRLDDEVPF
jgi:hypothetical protein